MIEDRESMQRSEQNFAEGLASPYTPFERTVAKISFRFDRVRSGAGVLVRPFSKSKKFHAGAPGRFESTEHGPNGARTTARTLSLRNSKIREVIEGSRMP